MSPFSPAMKSVYILQLNIRALLAARKETEAQLAVHLGFKHRSSLNKFLNNEWNGFQMWRLDRLADFFGLATYQLFQPGISPLTERRHGRDRRSGLERRVGHASRLAHIPTPHPPRRRLAQELQR